MIREPSRVTRNNLADYCAPSCPHCGEPAMGEATISLDFLLWRWPPAKTLPVEVDGYAASIVGCSTLVVSCPACEKPVAVAIDETEIKLVAMRTAKDEQLLTEIV